MTRLTYKQKAGSIAIAMVLIVLLLMVIAGGCERWESKDSNLSAYDLQSLPAAPASFPLAEDVGIEPCPFGPHRFSRPLAHQCAAPSMRRTVALIHNPLRSRSLAGWPYPGRLVLHCAPDGIRTRKIQILSLTRIPVPSQAHRYSRKDSNLQYLDPKSSAFTSFTTGANKKASDFSEAVCTSRFKNIYTQYSPGPDKRDK